VKRLLLAALLVILFAVPFLALAQSQDAPVEPVAVFTPPTPETVADGLIALLLSVFAGAIASPVTMPIVSVVKRLPFLDGFSGDQLNLAVAMLLSVLTWLAGVFGLAPQLDTLFQVIVALSPVFAGLYVSYASNQGLYRWANSKNMPIVGFARTPQRVQRSTVVG
jgi:hypothetical protein